MHAAKKLTQKSTSYCKSTQIRYCWAEIFTWSHAFCHLELSCALRCFLNSTDNWNADKRLKIWINSPFWQQLLMGRCRLLNRTLFPAVYTCICIKIDTFLLNTYIRLSVCSANYNSINNITRSMPETPIRHHQLTIIWHYRALLHLILWSLKNRGKQKWLPALLP